MNALSPSAVAVTGASGFLGSHLTRRLLADGHTVSVLVRDPAKLDALGLQPHRTVQGDIRDRDALAQLMEGNAVAIHLVSNFRTAKDPADVHHAVNVEGTRRAFAAARDAGVRRFVNCSTIGVHGHVENPPANEDSPFNPGDLYQETKLAAEQRLREDSATSGVETVILRPCSQYGPGDLRMLKMFRSLAKRRFPLVGDCQSNFHPVYIDDVVDAFVLSMTVPEAAGGTFIIGGPRYLPLRDYILAAATAVGAPPPPIRLPYGLMNALAVTCESLCRPLGIDPPLHRRRVRFFRNNRAFDISRARTVLGYAPKVDLEEGLARTVAWYRDQGLMD